MPTRSSVHQLITRHIDDSIRTHRGSSGARLRVTNVGRLQQSDFLPGHPSFLNSLNFHRGRLHFLKTVNPTQVRRLKRWSRLPHDGQCCENENGNLWTDSCTSNNDPSHGKATLCKPPRDDGGLKGKQSVQDNASDSDLKVVVLLNSFNNKSVNPNHKGHRENVFRERRFRSRLDSAAFLREYKAPIPSGASADVHYLAHTIPLWGIFPTNQRRPRIICRSIDDSKKKLHLLRTCFEGLLWYWVR